ncbi:hypothetical protein GN956_G9013 [Arapaima gigas]
MILTQHTVGVKQHGAFAGREAGGSKVGARASGATVSHRPAPVSSSCRFRPRRAFDGFPRTPRRFGPTGGGASAADESHAVR